MNFRCGSVVSRGSLVASCVRCVLPAGGRHELRSICVAPLLCESMLWCCVFVRPGSSLRPVLNLESCNLWSYCRGSQRQLQRRFHGPFIYRVYRGMSRNWGGTWSAATALWIPFDLNNYYIPACAFQAASISGQLDFSSTSGLEHRATTHVSGPPSSDG